MKFLMVGLGGIGQRHVRNLRSLLGSDANIIAYRYRNNSQVLTEQLSIEQGSTLAEKYDIKVYDNFESALNEKPDAVFICNPSSLHIPTALKAALAGCNLFIEKPLSHKLDQVDELINIVEEKNIKAAVGYQMRFHPCLTRLHTLIENQTIGNIIAVRMEVGEYLPGWHTYEDYRQLYASREDLGGGVVLTQIHEFDYAYWLFGFPKRVFAMGGHLSSLDINVEDTASILLECNVNGRPIPISVHMDYIQRPPSRTCEIVGNTGKILVDLRALTINVFDNQGSLTESTSYEGYQRNQLFLDELKHYLEYIQGNANSKVVKLSEAAKSLRIAVAVKESLLTHKIVDLTNQTI